MKLKDRVALVTGGASGIGLATAQRFLREGARVALCDIDGMRARQAAAAVADGEDRCLGIEVDVSRNEEVAACVADVLRRFGRIDILVNNAGITRDAQLVRMTEAQWDDVVDANLKGVFLCSQAVAPAMIEAGHGVILNASSVVGLYGNFGQSNYAATKAGVVGLTRTWARELGPKGVRVNAVCPGFIATDMLKTIPPKILARLESSSWMGRLGDPAEVAGVYTFLASDDAAFVNGVCVEVSGGMSL